MVDAFQNWREDNSGSWFTRHQPQEMGCTSRNFLGLTPAAIHARSNPLPRSASQRLPAKSSQVVMKIPDRHMGVWPDEIRHGSAGQAPSRLLMHLPHDFIIFANMLTTGQRLSSFSVQYFCNRFPRSVVIPILAQTWAGLKPSLDHPVNGARPTRTCSGLSRG
jgi:hypothetical protein